MTARRTAGIAPAERLRSAVVGRSLRRKFALRRWRVVLDLVLAAIGRRRAGHVSIAPLALPVLAHPLSVAANLLAALFERVRLVLELVGQPVVIALGHAAGLPEARGVATTDH